MQAQRSVENEEEVQTFRPITDLQSAGVNVSPLLAVAYVSGVD